MLGAKEATLTAFQPDVPSKAGWPPLMLCCSSRVPSSFGPPRCRTVANTLASLPFIFLIAVVSTVCVYWLADLRGGAGYVWVRLDLSCVLCCAAMMPF